jgi:hypothetical protein
MQRSNGGVSMRKRYKAKKKGSHSLAQLQALHETNWPIEDLYSDLSWGTMEGYYDP